ncbi:MspA family porin [Rhodococcus sp. O3]|uniref:MspA family porin n=1 Tax=Rhodococcus sp. O3 TaxID=3404919 RepID=UPI003B66CA5F
MKIQTRRGLKAARNAAVAGAAVAGLVLGSSGVASADVDDQNRIVSAGNEVIVTQKDTFIQGVPPIGGSPLSRQWFHNGVGVANIVGPDAADFEDSTFQFGYQFAWSAAIDGSIGVSWNSPDLAVTTTGNYVAATDANGDPIFIRDGLGNEVLDANGERIPAYTYVPKTQKNVVDSILPQANAGVALTAAPGIEELVVAEGEFNGDFKEVQIANVSGAATGVIGPVQVRPFVRVITANGDNVTTYGKVWTI